MELKDLLRSKAMKRNGERKQLIISCDAFPYGVEAVLFHRENNIEKPIAFWSHTLGKVRETMPKSTRKQWA